MFKNKRNKVEEILKGTSNNTKRIHEAQNPYITYILVK